MQYISGGRFMGSLRLVLGWEQLLEADQAALPAIRGLCAALEIRTHYHHPSQTLYIEPPVLGRQVAVTAAEHETDLFLTAAQRIVQALQQRLEQGGAQVAGVSQSVQPPEADLTVHISVGAIPEWGVSMAYNWLRCSHNRKLAAVLAEEVSWATGLENLGARVSLAAGTQAPGTPTIEVLIGQPGPDDIGCLKEDRFLDAVAEGVFMGLSRFWANPTLEEMRQPEPLPEPASVPDSDPDPEPEPLLHSVPIAVVEVDPDPVIDLDPQPMVQAAPPRLQPRVEEEEPVLAEYALLAAAPSLPPPPPQQSPLSQEPQESLESLLLEAFAPPSEPAAQPPALPTRPPKTHTPNVHDFAWRQNRRVSKPRPLVITDQGGPVIKFP